MPSIFSWLSAFYAQMALLFDEHVSIGTYKLIRNDKIEICNAHAFEFP